ncbi:MAG: lipoyl domain-containing protein [Pirellulaceae bacterium]
MSDTYTIILPDLGLGPLQIRASSWHAEIGESLRTGDRLLELVSDSLLVDLPVPVPGVLRVRLVAEDEFVTTGQALAVLELHEE